MRLDAHWSPLLEFLPTAAMFARCGYFGLLLNSLRSACRAAISVALCEFLILSDTQSRAIPQAVPLIVPLTRSLWLCHVWQPFTYQITVGLSSQ
jgi:hypothetical protein